MKNIKLALILLLAISLVFAIWNIYDNIHDLIVKQKIIKYMTEDTEDQGCYVILLEPATEYKTDMKNTIFYFAKMVDNDGDYEEYVVKYTKGDIDLFEVEW